MRNSIKEPIQEIYEACQALSDAADAHLSGDRERAAELFKKADCAIAFSWIHPAWVDVEKNVVDWKPEADTHVVKHSERDPIRNISAGLKREVLERDGYHCRYCGIPVIHADIRKIAHKLYPDAVRWNPYDALQQHAAFAVMWLQFDHVRPHSHGGRSSADNVVVTCGLCNFGKHGYTLRQLDISDPFLRPPIPSEWDGLERLRSAIHTKPGKTPAGMAPVRPLVTEEPQTYFLPGARVSSGGFYLYTPPIAGTERCFTLGPDISVEPSTRGGVTGYRLTCSPAEWRRRGILSEAMLYRDNPESQEHYSAKATEIAVNIHPAGSRPSQPGSPDYFTGQVRLDPLITAPEPARVAAAAVTFEPGARTAWHTHPLGQTLIVTAGLGRAQREGGPVQEIRPGDVVWFAPGERHWHGAGPETAMTHIAIQERLDGSAVTWMEHVSDADYNG